jgi:predicted Co/Zn/Cd cation transporter (cation efflux family)
VLCSFLSLGISNIPSLEAIVVAFALSPNVNNATISHITTVGEFILVALSPCYIRQRSLGVLRFAINEVFSISPWIVKGTNADAMMQKE